MKLIVAGATGFVGREVIRLSLRRPDITSVIALSRAAIPMPAVPEDGADTSKLRNVVIKNYGEYPDSIKKEFAGADACIWTVAITPSKSKESGFAEAKRVCQEYPLAALKEMHTSGVNRPFRFIYMSGVAAERDQNRTPSFRPEYSLMRGETENLLLAIAAESKGDLEVCAAKPGWIKGPGFSTRSIMAFGLWMMASVPSISVTEVSAAMLEMVAKGFEKEPSVNADLLDIGRRALSASS